MARVVVSLSVLLMLLAAACTGGDGEGSPTPGASSLAAGAATRAGQPPTAAAPILEGVFETRFEHATFFPGVACPAGGAPYALAWALDLDLAQLILDETGQDPFAEAFVPVFRVRFAGVVSAPGAYGPGGEYTRQAVVHELRSVTIAEECDALAASELRLARARWQARGAASYVLRFVRHCECGPEFAGPIEVAVVDGVITAIQYDVAAEEGVPPPAGAALTVDELFDAIDQALASGVETRVSYDAELGYPLTVRLDLEAIPRDGGFSVDVLSLAPAE